MNQSELFYLKQEEPIKNCFLALSDIILKSDNHITTAFKYGMPFFCYDKKMLCYFWIHKKYKKPYIGFADGNLIDDPDLIQEKRSRMKILLIDPEADIPVEKIKEILKIAVQIHQ